MFHFATRNLRLLLVVPAVLATVIAAAHGLHVHHLAEGCLEGSVCPK